jgi:uncharacterized membrane protein YfcA
MDFVWVAIGGFIFIAFTLEAITGFGSIVIALALGAQLVPIEQLVPILSTLSVVMSTVMVWRHRHHIDRALLLRTVLPGMVLGTALGYAVKPLLNAGLMRQIFGVLIVWFASRELWRLRRAHAPVARPPWLSQLLVVLAGVTHGLFASGGPLLVYAASGMAINKARFRATLVSVWLTLNTGLTVAFWLDGRLLPALPKAAAYLPIIAAGFAVGDWLHQRVSEARFRLVIYSLLCVTGILLILPK